MSKCSRLSRNDPSSFANTEDIVVTDINLNLQINFDKQILKGSVTLTFDKKKSEVEILVLDTRDVKIENIRDPDTDRPLTFTVGQPVHTLGSKLEIQLLDTENRVEIWYQTSPSCTALQWLTPAQTAGKQHPYLFSQNQAIHCRSMVPCQDTPFVKSTYSAKVSVTSDLEVLMSAVKQATESDPRDDSCRLHSFHQMVPMPSYLIALVAGDIESREIGPRSRVWSEKEMVDAAAHEFAETEKMLVTAEELLGPYVWGVYDLLVLPPSFPYGGMENPCLTFVTPTLLAGDRSLAGVVAHEITHSWMGNLVSPSNWEHFWLNEGNTVFVERKIKGRMTGEKHRHFSAIGGWKELKYQIEEVFGSEHAYTHLVPDLTGVDPDDAFSTVPYEKGSNLLMYLESLLGGADVFDGFLKEYVDKFKYKSITTHDWKEFLYNYFQDQKEVLDRVEWETWFHKPGMPPVKPQYDTSLADACIQLAQRWSSAEDDDLDGFHDDDIQGMSSTQVRGFLAELLELPALTETKLTRMNKVYKLSEVGNSELKFRWLRLCLRAHCCDYIQPALQFVQEQGRLKFVRPIYRDLYQWEESRSAATDHYQRHKLSMHSLAATMVGKDLDQQ